jgi:hypothetical protein
MLQTKIHLDSNGQDLVIEHVQDVEPILQRNHMLRSLDQVNTDGLKEIAEIPNVTLIKWLDEEHARGNHNLRLFTPEFDAIMKKKLEDPEWKYLRTDKPSLIMGWMGFGS